MKQITVYTIDELNDRATEKAHQSYLSNGLDFDYSDNIGTLKAFENVFPVKIKDWSFDSNRSDVSFEMTCDNEISELRGIRLLKYLYNNFGSDLFKPKYIRALKTDDRKVSHKRVKTQTFYTGKFYNWYYSAINFSSDYTLTGYCLDYDILKPIYDFLKAPDNTTFEDLMNDCLQSWALACQKECEYQESFEAFKETAEINEWHFTENGEMV